MREEVEDWQSFIHSLKRKVEERSNHPRAKYGVTKQYTLKDLKRLYEKDQMPIRQIGILLGVEVYTDYKVRLLLERAGVVFRKQGRGYKIENSVNFKPRYKPPMLTEADIEEDIKTRIFK